MKKLLKKILITSCLCIGPITDIFGQSQPQIQSASVRAPLNIKVDGELKEWGDIKLNAYNIANRIYYVVSNDDDNLYFTIRGSGSVAANKILKDGITFTLSHTLKKAYRNKDSKNVSLTYPTITRDASIVSYMIAPVARIATLNRDTLKYKKQIDSLTMVSNNRISGTGKEIKVTGIKAIKDSLLSVYNDSGIKAAIHFSKGDLITEVAIPLKYLDMTITAPLRFSYNIKLNVPQMTGDFDIRSLQKSGDNGNTGSLSPDDAYRITETELWGEYILAKKIL